MKKILLILTVITFTLISSCSGGRGGENLSYVAGLTKVLSQKYRAEQIEVKINNGEALSITMVNAEEVSGPAEKQNMALEIGKIARSQKNVPDLQSGEVNFVQRSSYFIATTTDSETYDMFLKRGTSAQVQSTGHGLER